MPRRIRVLLAFVAIVVTAVGAAASAVGPPLPEPRFLEPVSKLVGADECAATPDNPYEGELYTNPYGDSCKRLHFVFGPILAKPGQNDVLIEPVKIEKPAYPGYIVRFRPDLVDAIGKPPSIAEIHLHHATWLGYPEYGSGPFFAAGEEKTIATFPPGYGMKIKPTDVWLLLYMVHNAISTPRLVWITYDIDFVAEAEGNSLGIVPVRPIWLDVQRRPVAEGAPSTSGNPVFNVQKGYGHIDPAYGDRLVCRWPDENCARHDVYGGVTPQQGEEIPHAGADWEVPADFAGTLIGIGGHLHPGGFADEVSLVRPGVGEKLIFRSDSVAWDHDNPSVAGGPHTSWDFSMTVTGSTIGWKVKIQEGDILRLNAIYDSQDASWYENMGIVVALVAPEAVELDDAAHGGPGVDVFAPGVVVVDGYPEPAIDVTGFSDALPVCTPSETVVCLRGQVTHGHMEEAGPFGGEGESPIDFANGPIVDQIAAAGFTYGLADWGLVGQFGIPRVRVGKPVRFWNLDTFANIWHTYTRCKEPCTGAYGIDYPLANGSLGANDAMDFDSTEIGYGLFFTPASGQLGSPENKPTQEALQDGLYWTFTPTQLGRFSLYCRIHPGMRGFIEVVEETAT